LTTTGAASIGTGGTSTPMNVFGTISSTGLIGEGNVPIGLKSPVGAYSGYTSAWVSGTTSSSSETFPVYLAAVSFTSSNGYTMGASHNKVALYSGALINNTNSGNTWSLNTVLALSSAPTYSGFAGQGYELDIQNNTTVDYTTIAAPTLWGMNISAGGTGKSAVALYINGAGTSPNIFAHFNYGIFLKPASVIAQAISDFADATYSYVVASTATRYMGIDTTLATGFTLGALRVGSGQAILSVNNAVTSNITLLSTNSSDQIIFGDGATNIQLGADIVTPTDNTLKIGSLGTYFNEMFAYNFTKPSDPALKKMCVLCRKCCL
jgi:hypothetical protein